MIEFLVELALDGYDADEDQERGCIDFIEDQLGAAAHLKVRKLDGLKYMLKVSKYSRGFTMPVQHHSDGTLSVWHSICSYSFDPLCRMCQSGGWVHEVEMDWSEEWYRISEMDDGGNWVKKPGTELNTDVVRRVWEYIAKLNNLDAMETISHIFEIMINNKQFEFIDIFLKQIPTLNATVCQHISKLTEPYREWLPGRNI